MTERKIVDVNYSQGQGNFPMCWPSTVLFNTACFKSLWEVTEWLLGLDSTSAQLTPAPHRHQGGGEIYGLAGSYPGPSTLSHSAQPRASYARLRVRRLCSGPASLSSSQPQDGVPPGGPASPRAGRRPPGRAKDSGGCSAGN